MNNKKGYKMITKPKIIKGVKYVPYGYYLKYGKINPKYAKR
jgi:hypothetical protein